MPDAHEFLATPAQLAHVSRLIEARLGLHYPEDRLPDLRQALNRAAPDFGFGDVESFSRWLLSTPLSQPRIEQLAAHLTIGETYFFRDPAHFQALEREVFPRLFQERREGNRQLRIWCAGCATGEEPYSIAMLLRRMLPDLHNWQVNLRATDLNPHSLEHARRGVYRRWAFRMTPDWALTTYFSPAADETFAIAPQIKAIPRFESFNLSTEELLPGVSEGSLDLILCRNVLMYFSPITARRVARNFLRHLRPGGWLIVSASELSQELYAGFESVRVQDAFLYRKPLRLSASARAETGEPTGTALPAGPAIPAPRTPEPRRTEPAATGGFSSPDPPAMPRRAPTSPMETARHWYAAGNYQMLVDEPVPADASRSDRLQWLLLQARAAANLRHLDQALTLCHQALALDRLHGPTHHLAGVLEEERGQDEEAARAFRKALYADPDFVMGHVALGNNLSRRGRTAEARNCHEQAASLLARLPGDAPVPDADGLTAGQLLEILRSTHLSAV